MKGLKLLLQIVDKGLAVAQWVDGLLTRRRAKKRFEDLVERQSAQPDRSRAPTVILRRRPPPPPPRPR